MTSELLKLINSRRTIRKYSYDRINRKQIYSILSAARMSQSAHNMQPWKFVVTDNRNIILKIADMMKKKSKKTFIGFNILLKESSKTVMGSRALIAVYNTRSISKRFSRLGGKYKKLCDIYEIQSIAAALQNMSLVSSALGIGLAWIGIALFCENEINKLLKQDDGLMAILTLGYPAESPTKPKRKTIKEISIFM